MLQIMTLQWVNGYDWATELNWTEAYSNSTVDFKEAFGTQLLELPSEHFTESITVFPKIHVIEGKYHIIIDSIFIN